MASIKLVSITDKTNVTIQKIKIVFLTKDGEDSALETSIHPQEMSSCTAIPSSMELMKTDSTSADIFRSKDENWWTSLLHQFD